MWPDVPGAVVETYVWTMAVSGRRKDGFDSVYECRADVLEVDMHRAVLF